MANPRWAETSVPKNLPDRVAQIYYGHGLFCASHPTLVIILTSIIIVLCSYPLSNLPLPGNIPQSFSTHISQGNVTVPRWFHGTPKLYVQQVIMKSTVSPWNDDLLLTDAFRGPLAESFKLTEIVHNYQHSNKSLSLDNLCLHIENVKKKSNKVGILLPEYNCLLLSPGNLWQQDFNKFQLDSNLINTVYNYENLGKGKISFSEMLFGLPLKEAGVKRYPLRKKQRVIQFAVTIFMNHYQPLYIEGLQTYLKKLYPLTESLSNINNNSQSYIHIYFPEDVNYWELIPLSLTYIILFLYMYFSMRKVEFIKSKICMAFGAFLTVLASLSMTIGVCFFFGLEFTGGKEGGKQIFPYLVIIVGLENVLVLVKSVVSTTSHLDVKIRVAQGLSKEGWNITKNLLIEVTILTFGLLTFVPAIQEFCIFTIVGLLSDFFLQIVFFCTMLSLNVECTERSAFPHYSYSLNVPHSSKVSYYTQNIEDRKLPRSRSHPRLAGQNVIAPVRNHKIQPSEKMSKRVKVVHFWARTRFVQRSFMVGMILWIAIIVYNAETIQNFTRSIASESDEDVKISNEHTPSNTPKTWKIEQRASILDIETKLLRVEEEAKQIKITDKMMNVDNISEEYIWLKKVDYDTRRRLSLHHWSSILSLYNVTLSGSYITVLPPINVVHIVSPELAQSLRNPEEKGIRFRWQSLAVALDPLDFPDVESTMKNSINIEGEERVRPFIPSSPMEIFMATLLCITSVFVVVYMVIVLYRCICTRNYAEWRSSWTNSNEVSSFSPIQVVMEALPIAIKGHSNLVECIATDGNLIASTCLGGQVKIWDGITGELIVDIERNKYENKNQSYNGEIQLSEFKNSQNDSLIISDKCSLNSNVYNTHDIDESSQKYYNESLNRCAPNSPDVDSHLTTHVLDKRKERFSHFNNIFSNNTEINDKLNHQINKPIWCIDCKNNIIVLGCADGILEFWECSSGKLKCKYFEEDRISITGVKLMDDIVLASKLNGSLSFYKLDVLFTYPSNEYYNGITKHRRGHLRTGSVDSMCWQNGGVKELRCLKIESSRAHTKPITVLEAEGERVITGSEDRTLKVFRIENQTLQYTLHGHYGPITCMFIDRFYPVMAGSGSQDGLLCVWDLHTGACMYSIQAHDGTIFALAYSASYVISLGQDQRLCVWDRFQGHLLNTIPVIDAYCTSLCMLTHNLLITSKQGCLIVLDVGTGETIRLVKLGSHNSCVFIRHILNVGDGIVCDYGDQLRLVRFPLVCDKND